MTSMRVMYLRATVPLWRESGWTLQNLPWALRITAT